MSAHDQSVRINGAQASNESVIDDATRPSLASEAYYVLLAERLEALLWDMEQNGTPTSDPLLVRLSDLLVETRELLGNASSVGKAPASVPDR